MQSLSLYMKRIHPASVLPILALVVVLDIVWVIQTGLTGFSALFVEEILFFLLTRSANLFIFMCVCGGEFRLFL